MLKGAGTKRVLASCKLSVLALGRGNAGGASSKVCVLGREWRRGYASGSSTELGNLGYDGEWDSFLEFMDRGFNCLFATMSFCTLIFSVFL